MNDERQEKNESDAKIQDAVEEIRESPGSPRDAGPPPEPNPEDTEITDRDRESPLVNDSSFPGEAGSEQSDRDKAD